MSAETPAAPGQFDRRRLQFRSWRGTRPFWAGLYILIAGFPIMYFPYAHLQLGHLTIAMATTAGAGSLIIGVLLVVLGISVWFQKHIRTFAGVAAILLALVSLPVSNFGGFIMGFLFALIGGAMAVAWSPGVPPQPEVAWAPGTPQPEGDVPQTEGHTPGADDRLRGSDGMGVANDLSGTSPLDGANGRHSAG
ncbi:MULTISPECIES: DUF6114 domain-containing protein [unclassified Streptomyces]|jgi:hypothetical protein|uniref:DUF6114 domain-containing protein n=1 Tax=unclassified Streptomyces TaxID=2593676 RepID=UPI0033237355